MPREREEIKVLFERIGFGYKIGKFNAIYNKAKEFMWPAGTIDDRVSVRAYMQAVNLLHFVD